MAPSFEIVVVGAGPAGSVAAREAARLGCGPVLLVEQARMPRAKPCGGGISPKARKILKGLDLWTQVERRAYPICGLRLVSPNGKETIFQGANSASVLNRSEFDQILVDNALSAGVQLRPDTRVDGLPEKDGRVLGVRCGNQEILARWVIVANGARTRFNRDPRSKHILHTCLAWFEGVPFVPNVLEMVYDQSLLPHYGWLFPESENRVNIGICLEAKRLQGGSIRELFAAFLDRYYADRLSRARQIGRWHGHPISTTVRVEHHAASGVLLIGEANRLTNIATGEGISYAMRSGILAARAIAVGRKKNLNDVETTRWFVKRLRRSTERNFKLAKLYCRVGIKTLNGITRLGRHLTVSRLASRTLARL